jgi:UDP-glucose 4-epimerase
LDGGVHRFIFSSTAATYGEPETMPIAEDALQNPINVYGHSKRLVEEMCEWLSRLTPFRYVALRYFNACGCHPSGELGEDHRPETHLIPMILQVPLGRRATVHIYGDDYPTPDGTCVRDYIHVMDLVRAHVKAMAYLAAGGASGAFNLGAGAGYSVRQIVEAAREVTGHAIPAERAPRRAGDPPELVARVDKAEKAFDWRATESDLPTIVGSAWNWLRLHPDGYPE